MIGTIALLTLGLLLLGIAVQACWQHPKPSSRYEFTYPGPEVEIRSLLQHPTDSKPYDIRK